MSNQISLEKLITALESALIEDKGKCWMTKTARRHVAEIAQSMPHDERLALAHWLVEYIARDINAEKPKEKKPLNLADFLK